jgi:ornithine cyclodeaminase/alanine dehydrogenase-like protein (mu-crystallin family)
VRYLDADAVAALGPAAAVRAVTDALRGGLDPAADPPRLPVGLAHGQFLLMPSETAAAAGVKVATVAPDNPARGLPGSRPPTCCSTGRPWPCARCSTGPR